MPADSNDLVFKALNYDALGDMLKIENDVHLAPWSEQKFLNCFNNNRYLVTGLFNHNRLVGYAVLLVISSEAELHNIAIDKPFQKHGIGKLLLDYLVQQCVKHDLKQIFLEVRESNAAAINLYQKSGFTQISIRKDYYQSQALTESALLFMLDISKS